MLKYWKISLLLIAIGLIYFCREYAGYAISGAKPTEPEHTVSLFYKEAIIKKYNSLKKSSRKYAKHMKMQKIKNKFEASRKHTTAMSRIIQYENLIPQEWGMEVKGVRTHLDIKEKAIALTFDACGTYWPADDYDEYLIKCLKKEQTPATLFLSGRWIDAHPAIVKELAQDPLFEIENHGLNHRPLCVYEESVYGIRGTNSVREVVDEIKLNGLKIKKLTGRTPHFFRSGTAHYDDVSVKIAHALGYEVVNFTVNGDGGATYSYEEVKEKLMSALPGSVIIFHMNHPEMRTAEGVMAGIEELKKKGFKFVKLSDCRLK